MQCFWLSLLALQSNEFADILSVLRQNDRAPHLFYEFFRLLINNIPNNINRYWLRRLTFRLVCFVFIHVSCLFVCFRVFVTCTWTAINKYHINDYCVAIWQTMKVPSRLSDKKRELGDRNIHTGRKQTRDRSRKMCKNRKRRRQQKSHFFFFNSNQISRRQKLWIYRAYTDTLYAIHIDGVDVCVRWYNFLF